jgi:uncharacterized protein YrrD
MLRRIKDIMGLTIRATDDEIGKTKDVYFEDDNWQVAYVVVDTGRWLPGRRVLLSPQAVTGVDWDDGNLEVNLTRDAIEQSPSIEQDRPVSRQHQIKLAAYYGWMPYWAVSAGPGQPWMPEGAAAQPANEVSELDEADPHLRSFNEVTGYHVHTPRGEVGHVEDALVQTDGWAIRYLVVDTGAILPGKKVLLSPAWVEDVDWVDGTVKVRLAEEEIRNAPDFDEVSAVDEQYERELHDHYQVARQDR